MAKNKHQSKTIRFDRFKEQLEEVGVNELQAVELSTEDTIYMRLGVSINGGDEDDAFNERMRWAKDSRSAALIVLDYYDGATAEEQLATLERHGGTPDELAVLWASATRDKQEELGKVRPRR